MISSGGDKVWHIIASVSLVAAICTCVAAIRSARQVRLRSERSGESFETFFEHFSGEQISEHLCLVIYRYLQRLVIRDFPVRPTDDLTKVYGIGKYAGVGFLEAIDDLCDELGIEVPSNEELSSVVNELGSVRKVEDLVRLFSHLQRRASQM